MSKYLLALDAGTGSIRAVLFSVDGELRIRTYLQITSKAAS